jgi:prevent-host-death family protein
MYYCYISYKYYERGDMLLMEKKLNISEVRDSLRDLVDEVQYQNNKLVILRHGKPAVALVPLHVYENWKSSRRRLFELIEQAQTVSGDQDPDEVMELVLEAQGATREETGKA